MFMTLSSSGRLWNCIVPAERASKEVTKIYKRETGFHILYVCKHSATDEDKAPEHRSASAWLDDVTSIDNTSSRYTFFRYSILETPLLDMADEYSVWGCWSVSMAISARTEGAPTNYWPLREAAVRAILAVSPCHTKLPNHKTPPYEKADYSLLSVNRFKANAVCVFVVI